MEYLGRRLRQELKYYINAGDYHTLRARLRAVAEPDPNMPDPEGYLVTSLYFDDVYHSAMAEKRAGYRFRKKFRLRCYGRSDGRILLECKRKYGEYVSKDSVPLLRREYDGILSGEYGFLLSSPSPLCQELYARHQTRLLRPAAAVEYLREAYVAQDGAVRVTFDKDLSASIGQCDPFSESFQVHRVLEPGRVILEIKFDGFLPDALAQVLKTPLAERCSISKYAMCRGENRRLLYR